MLEVGSAVQVCDRHASGVITSAHSGGRATEPRRADARTGTGYASSSNRAVKCRSTGACSVKRNPRSASFRAAISPIASAT